MWARKGSRGCLLRAVLREHSNREPRYGIDEDVVCMSREGRSKRSVGAGAVTNQTASVSYARL